MLNKFGDQQGGVLMFCLVFLLVLTMMGTAGMETSILEDKMAAHWQDHSIAIQAAESALRTGEIWLQNLQSLPEARVDGASAVWFPDSLDADTGNGLLWWQEAAVEVAEWWQAHATAVGGFDHLAQPPFYVLEQLTSHDLITEETEEGCNTVQRVYRLTARGNGVNSVSVVMLQSEQLLVFQCSDQENLSGSVKVELSGRFAWRWL